MSASEVTCCLSGLAPSDEEVVPDDGNDDNGDIPAGWTRITLVQREPNPRREAISAMKVALVDQALAQVPAKQREEAQFSVELQVDAQFAALEATTPAFFVSEETVYLAPSSRDAQVAAEILKLRGMLGLIEAEGSE